MQIGKPGDPVSRISQAYPGPRGGAPRDLRRRSSWARSRFTEYFHLLLTGKDATEEQRYFLDVLLVAIAEHGMMPTNVAARMTLAADPESLQGAVAAGILGAGPVVLGTSEECARLLAAARAQGAEPAAVAAEVVRDISEAAARSRGSDTPCIGRSTRAPSGSSSSPTPAASAVRTSRLRAHLARLSRRPAANR